MNYDAAFKNIDDTLWKDAGCGSELDYIEQTSWILFLKYLDDLEKENKSAAELSNKTYAPILSNEFSWETWAALAGKCLIEAGYTNIYNLGGFKDWVKAGGQIEVDA